MQNYPLFEEYITLGQFLKELGLISTGGQAKFFLAENAETIFVNGNAENRRGKKLHVDDVLELSSFDISIKFTLPDPDERAAHDAQKAEEAQIKDKLKSLKRPDQKSLKSAPPRSPFHK